MDTFKIMSFIVKGIAHVNLPVIDWLYSHEDLVLAGMMGLIIGVVTLIALVIYERTMRARQRKPTRSAAEATEKSESTTVVRFPATLTSK